MSTARALPIHMAFNRSAFSQFINSRGGRAFRLGAGAAFLVAGYASRTHPAGIAAMLWSVLPLSAGAFDLCYISALLGGPISGSKIRAVPRSLRAQGEVAAREVTAEGPAMPRER